jgi:phage terminase large subunit-like protein
MRFCERFLCVPDGDLVGQPIKLAEFQEYFFYAVFDNQFKTRRAFLSKARKNAKTATIAMILLCFLVGPEAKENAQIVSGALSKKQAALVFKLACQMIQRSPKILPLVKIIPSQKILTGIPFNTEYQALSAEAGTTHGLSPILAILDEMGQIKGVQNDFLDAVLTSQGAHSDPLTIVISTQAPTDADWLSVQLDDAENSQDPKIVSHVYAADDECDILDHKQWEKANPALGLFLNRSELEEAAEKAARMPSFENTFRNLHLNMRCNMESPFVSRSVWEENGGKPDPLKGKKVYGGLDLSAVSDLTALVLVSEHGDVECEFWLPADGLREKSKSDRVPYDVWAKEGLLNTTPGASIEYEYIAYELKRIFDEYDVQQINFDRFAIKFLMPWLRKAGLTEKQIEKFKECGQGYVSMGNAIRELESRLLQRKLKHGMNPVLTMCAGNARIEMDAAGNRKFTKKKSTGRIDGLVSLAMAVDSIARFEENDKKEFSIHFI